MSPASRAGTASPPSTAPPHRGVLLEPQGLPPLAGREPSAEPRHPHGRGDPDPAPSQRGPDLLRPQDRRRARPPKNPSAPSSDASATRSTPDPSHDARRATPAAEK